MKKSRLLGAVFASAITFVSTSTNATVLQFEISSLAFAPGTGGPVTIMSSKFKVDTSAPLSNLSFFTSNDGVSYLSRFNIFDAIYDFHFQIDGIGNMDAPLTSSVLSSGPAQPGFHEGFAVAENGVERFYLEDFHRSRWMTEAEWLASSDPVADFFLDAPLDAKFWTASGGQFSTGVGPDLYAFLNPIQMTVTTAPIHGVPEPSTFSLLSFGLIGIAFIRSKMRT